MTRNIYFLLIWFMPLSIHCLENSFHHNVDYETDDSGERFKLHSSGVLSDVVDLDVTPGIKRLVCVDDRILLVTNQSDVGKDWKVGQLLLASSRWRCNATQESPGTGIYAKIASIYFPIDKRLSIHVVQAGPYDMIEEANIHFRYTPGRGDVPVETRTRHRRYLSNILAKILGDINWHANFSTRIPFNEDRDGKIDRVFTIHKSFGDEDLNTTISGNVTSDDFKVSCLSCHGRTALSYIFELIIKKVDNKPRLLKHTSQLQADTELESHMEIEFLQEMGVNYSRALWETGPLELIRIPVAIVRKLPPVELSLSYSTQTLAHVHGYSRGAVRARTGYTARGKYTLSQNYETNSQVHGEISSYDWKTNYQDDVGTDVKDALNFTVEIFQKIMFNATISWQEKDIFLDLSPPMEIMVNPSLKLETTPSGHEECVETQLDIKASFSIAKSELTVTAFGINIWDVVLDPRISKEGSLVRSLLSRTCRAHCAAPVTLGPPLSAPQVCGQMRDKIVRGSKKFQGLQVLHGDDIVFLDEESEYSWCGDTSTPCTSCNISNNADINSVCADRIVSARLAAALTKLHHMVKGEWQNESLVVIEAWDEPTSAFPNGQHGNSSLHYEGRAAVVTLSGDVDKITLERFGSLCVCSGFDYVKIDDTAAAVHVAVKENVVGERSKTSEEVMFDDAMSDRDIYDRVETCARNAPPLNVGETVPTGVSVDQICGPEQGGLDRVNRNDIERLFYYDMDDVEFSPEGSSTDVCGHPIRRCRSDCSHIQNQTEPWTWCSTRIMTPRMALKLRQLAKLAAKENIGIVVTKSFSENYSSAMNKFFQEGRGVQLKANSVSGASKNMRLATLTACSGFDYVNFVNDSVIEVFVRSSDGFLPTKVEFPDETANRLAVGPPKFGFAEYEYPKQLEEEIIAPQLVTGHDPETFLSEHIQIKDILSPNREYFRFDSSLLLCLDLVTDEYGQKVEILPGSGYRTQSVNMINFDIRHPEEKYRFQTGQAVELRPPRDKSQNDLLTLAKTVFRSCTPSLREEMRGVGLGCHRDRLYLDIRPLQVGNEMNYISVWEAEDTLYCNEVMRLQQELMQGGPVVHPFHKDICSDNPLGKEKSYLTFQFHQKGVCSTIDQPAFCSSTLRFRKEESRKLQERMTSAAGFGRLPRADIRKELDRCIVDLCGGCPGTGDIWDEKVKACSVVVDRFITRATRAFPDLTDRATFFNTETVQSSVHSLACHDGNICVENIQLYSLFMPLVTSRYRPDPNGSIETMMFSSEKNPIPLLELVEQEMAFKARGNVKVYVDHQSDLKDIRSLVKVLMVYNKNVTEVELHVTDDLDIDLIKADLQRSLDMWSGNTCSDTSRFAIAPFSFHKISHDRRKRSLERSVHRNEARWKIHNWELEWMMKLL